MCQHIRPILVKTISFHPGILLITARAAGGAGLIIFEGIRVHKSSLGRQQGVNGCEAGAIPKFRDVARAVREEGGKLFGQILHLGRHIDGNFARMASWSLRRYHGRQRPRPTSNDETGNTSCGPSSC